MLSVQLFQAPGYQNSHQYGFVEMSSTAEAQLALGALNVSRGGGCGCERGGRGAGKLQVVMSLVGGKCVRLPQGTLNLPAPCLPVSLPPCWCPPL